MRCQGVGNQGSASLIAEQDGPGWDTQPGVRRAVEVLEEKKEYKVLNSCQYWSMAPDGGKIGNKGPVLAPLAANGQALTMWAPPQDGGSHFHRLPLQIWRTNDFIFDEKTSS